MQQNFYKVLNIESKHNEFDKSCVSGDLFFTDIKNIFKYVNYGIYVAEVITPKNAQIVKDPHQDKWRTDKIITQNIQDLREINTLKNLIKLGADINKYFGMVIDFLIEHKNPKAFEYIFTTYKSHTYLYELMRLKDYDTNIASILATHYNEFSFNFIIQVFENDDLNTFKILKNREKLNCSAYKFCALYDSIKIMKFIYENNPEIKNYYYINTEIVCLILGYNSEKVFRFIIDNNFQFMEHFKDFFINSHIGKKNGISMLIQLLNNNTIIIDSENNVKKYTDNSVHYSNNSEYIV
ncbi:putative ankyrin repeat protein [Cotonvirus japonicus]|uniref:Ankyrin repeat protein n=1 Tax=Cotonvirus japonicus TaxID=2811091 RepID=A0ABM7NTU5_9VIRU|nr:putative ankyrin repeat protein [Cotonvirus japonicus]BCS83559.1 putative ankyrin repeat protein [Cotonvirus japonicus]